MPKKNCQMPEVRNPEAAIVQLQFVLPQLIDTKTFARMLGVCERNVRRIVQERQIEVVKVGRLVRFDVEVVREWIESRRRPPDCRRAN